MSLAKTIRNDPNLSPLVKGNPDPNFKNPFGAPEPYKAKGDEQAEPVAQELDPEPAPAPEPDPVPEQDPAEIPKNLDEAKPEQPPVDSERPAPASEPLQEPAPVTENVGDTVPVDPPVAVGEPATPAPEPQPTPTVPKYRNFGAKFNPFGARYYI